MRKIAVVFITVSLMALAASAALAGFTWQNVGNDLTVGRQCNASAVVNGKLYVIGGASGGQWNFDNIHNRVDAYDPTTNTWSQAASMNIARANFGVAAIGGKLYAYGGYNHSMGKLNSLEVYDPDTNTWSFASDGLRAVSWNGVTAANGELWSIGGEADGTGTGVTGMVQIYNPTADTWRTGPALPWGDSVGSQMSVVTNGDSTNQWVNVVGGIGWNSQINNFIITNAVPGATWNGMWVGLTGLNPGQIDAGDPNGANGYGVSAHNAFVYDNAVYEFGGDFGPYGVYNQVSEWTANGWVNDSDLPIRLTGKPNVGVIGDKVFITGGRTSTGALNTTLYVGTIAVPEPSALLALASGLTVIGAAFARKRRAI